MYVTNSYTQIAKDSQVEQMNRPFHGFFFSNFFHGQVRENPTTLLEKAS